jgi:MFS family permease
VARYAAMRRTVAQARIPRLPYSGRKPFYGWIIVFVGFITQIVQGLVTQGFSTYADLLHNEFGWSKAVLAGPRSVTSIQNSVLGPVAGFLIDRFGPRFVVGAGIAITGLGLILLGTTYSLWMYYLSNIVMALGLSLEGMMVMSVAVNNWFRRRGTLAQSVMLLGFSLAGVVGVPWLVSMQTSMGWHRTAFWTGAAVIAVGLPCSTLLRTRPETYGLLPDGDRPSASEQSGGGLRVDVESDFTLAQAIRTRAFWLLAFGWAVCMLGIGVVQVHLFLQLGEDVGLERTAAAVIWSIASFSNIPSRLVGGILGDKLPKNLTLGMSIALMGGSVFALAVATSFRMALLFAVPYGIGWGISTPVMNSIQGEYFGRRSQGVIRGWLQMVGLPFSIAAPVLAGYMADRQGTYRWTFIVMSVIMLAGAAITLLATRPRLPEKGVTR